MQAIQGVFDEGRVSFPFCYPEYEGPLVVLVVFPGRAEVDDPHGEGSAERCHGGCHREDRGDRREDFEF